MPAHPLYNPHTIWSKQDMAVLEYWVAEYTAARMLVTTPEQVAHYTMILQMVADCLDKRRRSERKD